MHDSFFLHIPPAPEDMRALADESPENLLLSAPGSTVVCTTRTESHVRYECRIDTTGELVGFFEAKKTTEAGQLGVRVTLQDVGRVAAEYTPYRTIALDHSADTEGETSVERLLFDTSFESLGMLFDEVLHGSDNIGVFTCTTPADGCVVYADPFGFGDFTLQKVGRFQTELRITRHWPKDSPVFEELRTALAARAYDYLKAAHGTDTEEAQQALRAETAMYHPLDGLIGILMQHYHHKGSADFEAAPTSALPSVEMQARVHTSCAVWEGSLDYVDGVFGKVLCYERRQAMTQPPAFRNALVMRADRSRGTVLYTSDAHFGEVLLRAIDATHTEITVTRRAPQDVRLFDAVRMHYCATAYEQRLALVANTPRLTEAEKHAMLEGTRTVHPLDFLVTTAMVQMMKDYSTHPELLADRAVPPVQSPSQQFTLETMPHPDQEGWDALFDWWYAGGNDVLRTFTRLWEELEAKETPKKVQGSPRTWNRRKGKYDKAHGTGGDSGKEVARKWQ